jgi:hypothetical protein
MRSHRYLLNRPGITFGKGAIRYSKPEHIDFNLVERMLHATVESTGGGVLIVIYITGPDYYTNYSYRYRADDALCIIRPVSIDGGWS